jgi:hypothetical protein
MTCDWLQSWESTSQCASISAEVPVRLFLWRAMMVEKQWYTYQRTHDECSLFEEILSASY